MCNINWFSLNNEQVTRISRRNLCLRDAIKNSVQRPHACIWQQLRRDVTSQTSSRRLALFQPSCPFWWKRVDSLQQSKWLISLWKIVNFRWKRCLSDGASDGALIWVDFVRGMAKFAELSRLMCFCVLFPFWKERGWSWWHSRFECNFRWNDWDLVPERGSLACCVKFCFWVAGHEDCFPSSILTAKQRSQTKMWGYVRGRSFVDAGFCFFSPGEGQVLGTADQGQEGADQAARGAQDWAAQPARGQGHRWSSLQAVQDVSSLTLTSEQSGC